MESLGVFAAGAFVRRAWCVPKYYVLFQIRMPSVCERLEQVRSLENLHYFESEIKMESEREKKREKQTL